LRTDLDVLLNSSDLSTLGYIKNNNLYINHIYISLNDIFSIKYNNIIFYVFFIITISIKLKKLTLIENTYT